jgi:hypothetical protein
MYGSCYTKRREILFANTVTLFPSQDYLPGYEKKNGNAFYFCLFL